MKKFEPKTSSNNARQFVCTKSTEKNGRSQLVCSSAQAPRIAVEKSRIGVGHGSSNKREWSCYPFIYTDEEATKIANDLIGQMTTEEKVGFTQMWFYGNNCGLTIQGLPRLGIPNLIFTDGPAGVRNGACPGGPNATDPQRTVLPSPIALAATFSDSMANKYGHVLGKESRQFGAGLMGGPGLNLSRELRGGRTFEYLGEDPVHAGLIATHEIIAIQKNNVIATPKHYSTNDQETNRNMNPCSTAPNTISANITERQMRESDLLAFEIAQKRADSQGVMTAYNRVNDTYIQGSHLYVQEILKDEFGLQGYALSDFFSTQSWEDFNAGLDVEMGFLQFGNNLLPHIASGEISIARLDDAVRRVLKTRIKFNQIDDPIIEVLNDPTVNYPIAQLVAEEGAVLLKNSGVLPIQPNQYQRIAIIGSNADIAVLQGGGSAQVRPPGGYAPVTPVVTDNKTYNCWVGLADFFAMEWVPSSPLDAIQNISPSSEVVYDSGFNIPAAASLAAGSDLVIVFAHSWHGEGSDLLSLELASGLLGLEASHVSSPSVDQDALIAALAAANPNIVVVLETGTAVLMPWLDEVNAVLQVWYPGIKGGEAIANLLFGAVNPSGKLPLTFPVSEADLPRPIGPADPSLALATEVDYTIEGQDAGYKWFDRENLPVLFPFGHGLSYTSFGYSSLKVSTCKDTLVIALDLKNTGQVEGAEVVQIYLGLPEEAGVAPKRFAASRKILLQPGEKQHVDIKLESYSPEHHFAIWDEGIRQWRNVNGKYTIYVGSSSRDIRLNKRVDLAFDCEGIQITSGRVCR